MSPHRVAAGVVTRMVGSEMVLLDYERGIYYGLDEVGAHVWKLLSDGMSLDEIVARLAEEYATDEGTLGRDVAELLRELEAKGLIELAG